MATTTVSGSTVTFSNSGAAANLSVQTSEDSLLAKFDISTILAESGGGTKTTFYSIDNGVAGDDNPLVTTNKAFATYDTDLLYKDGAVAAWIDRRRYQCSRRTCLDRHRREDPLRRHQHSGPIPAISGRRDDDRHDQIHHQDVERHAQCRDVDCCNHRHQRRGGDHRVEHGGADRDQCGAVDRRRSQCHRRGQLRRPSWRRPTWPATTATASSRSMPPAPGPTR